MPTQNILNTIWQELFGLTGNERHVRVQEIAQRYKKTEQTIYRWASKAGIKLRKERADKGKSKLGESTMKLGAALQLCSRRKSNHITLPACDAKELLEDSGILIQTVSDGRYAARLRDMQISAKHLCAPSPHMQMLSDHPNHVWQFDVTNCIQYFFDDKGMGERDSELELEKNKIIRAAKKIKKELLRYVIVDHCTGAFYLKYFYASGEKAEDGERFFFEAMSPKDKIIERAFDGTSGGKKGKYHFHGVPFLVYADRGSIARSKKLRNLYESLRIQFETHLPGNPRAKGMVEGLMKIINRFEARLIFKRPRNLNDINSWALDWTIKVNAIDDFRNFAPRSALWQKIRSEQLRLCPDEATFRRLVTTEPTRKKVSGGLLIAHNGNSYRVPDSNLANQYVLIRENAYESPAIDVHGNGYVWMIHPIQKDEFGRLTDGVRYGEYKSLKHTETQNAKIELEKIAAEQWGITWKGTGDKRRAAAPPVGYESPLQVFGHQADKVGNVEFLYRKGTPLEIIQPEMAENKPLKTDAIEISRGITARRISFTEFLKRLIHAVGPIPRELNQTLRGIYGESISIADADEILRQALNDNMEEVMRKLSIQMHTDSIQEKKAEAM